MSASMPTRSATIWASVPGRQFSNADIDEAVKRLFATGLFSDVRISQSGGTLVVQVDGICHRQPGRVPGNRRVRDNQLVAATQLGRAGLFRGRAAGGSGGHSRCLCAHRPRRCDRQLRCRRSRRATASTSSTTSRKAGRTKIASINFTGNNAYSDGRLRDVIATKQSNILSWLTRNDIYDEDRLRADEEALRRFYYNRGYADFQVVSALASWTRRATSTPSTSPSTKASATFRLHRYREHDPGRRCGHAAAHLTTREGRVYSASEVEDTLIALTERVAGMGYAFAQVTPRGDRDFNEPHDLDRLHDRPGPAHLCRADRDPRQHAHARLCDPPRIRPRRGRRLQSGAGPARRRRLEALDFFETINISTAPGSQADQVVLVVEVVEKATGEFSIGAATRRADRLLRGLLGRGLVAERNFLGAASRSACRPAAGRASRDFLSPSPSPISWVSAFRPASTCIAARGSSQIATTARPRAARCASACRSRATDGQLAYNLFRTAIAIAAFASMRTAIRCRIRRWNRAGFRRSCATPSPRARGRVRRSAPVDTTTRSTTCRIRAPGIYATFSTEVAGLGGDARFVKVTGRGTYYHTLNEEMDLVGVLTAGGGHVSRLRRRRAARVRPVQQHDRIIRGFDYNGIGPRDRRTGEHLGGTTYFHGTAEAQFPLRQSRVTSAFAARSSPMRRRSTATRSSIAGITPITGRCMAWRASVGAGISGPRPSGRCGSTMPIRCSSRKVTGSRTSASACRRRF
jgi:outer membrane protein insertion porin family